MPCEPAIPDVLVLNRPENQKVATEVAKSQRVTHVTASNVWVCSLGDDGCRPRINQSVFRGAAQTWSVYVTPPAANIRTALHRPCPSEEEEEIHPGRSHGFGIPGWPRIFASHSLPRVPRKQFKELDVDKDGTLSFEARLKADNERLGPLIAKPFFRIRSSRCQAFFSRLDHLYHMNFARHPFLCSF